MANANQGRMQCVVHNARVATPTHEYLANIGIRDGVFAAIVDVGTPLQGDVVVDAQGRYVLPGIIDPHVHLDARPGTSFEQMLSSDTHAAAAGGVTTIGLFVPYGDEAPADWCATYAQVFNANSLVDAGFHVLFLSPPNVQDLPKWLERGVPSWKLLIGYKGPQALGSIPIDDGAVWETFAAASKYPAPALAMVHAENPDLMLKGRSIIEGQGRTDMAAWNDSRPRFVEEECMRMCLFLAEVTGCRLYVVHMTIGEGVDLITEAKRKGLDVFAETCPQYLTHNSEAPVAIMRANPALANVNPPLRDRFSNEKLWAGLRRGTIDCVGSDHSPSRLAEKGTDLWKAPMGLGNTTEMILPVLLSEGVNKGRLSMQDVARVCCQNPARALGLYPRKGTIAIGSDGDLVIVDLDREAVVRPQDLHSRCDWNTWQGWTLRGWPACTILRGQLLYQDGRFLAEPGIGRFIPRHSGQ